MRLHLVRERLCKYYLPHHLNTGIGAGWFSAGTLQPQASLFATGFVTANDSALFSGALNNFRFGEKSRLFADAYLQVNRFTNQRFYGGPTIGDEARPGSNDSDEDSYISGSSDQFTLETNFKLGTSGWFRQQVLALNYWTSINTDWDENADGTIDHNPPPGFGSELGGFDRLRGYASERFNDKAAVHYTAELRLIPGIQPLRDLPILNYFQIDWWQIVPFVEAGRVSDKYNSDLYSKDLKWDVGVGFRLMTFRAVVRLDFAVGDEGGSVYAMVSQPFSRMGT